MQAQLKVGMVVYLLKLNSLDCVASRMVFLLSGNLE